MTVVTADEKLVSEFSADSLVEVRNTEGVVIGFFAPVRLEHAGQYATAAARAYSTGFPRANKTTVELLADLESPIHPAAG